MKTIFFELEKFKTIPIPVIGFSDPLNHIPLKNHFLIVTNQLKKTE